MKEIDWTFDDEEYNNIIEFRKGDRVVYTGNDWNILKNLVSRILVIDLIFDDTPFCRIVDGISGDFLCNLPVDSIRLWTRKGCLNKVQCFTERIIIKKMKKYRLKWK